MTIKVGVWLRDASSFWTLEKGGLVNSKSYIDRIKHIEEKVEFSYVDFSLSKWIIRT